VVEGHITTHAAFLSSSPPGLGLGRGLGLSLNHGLAFLVSCPWFLVLIIGLGLFALGLLMVILLGSLALIFSDSVTRRDKTRQDKTR
jgi:hypothetical protein